MYHQVKGFAYAESFFRVEVRVIFPNLLDTLSGVRSTDFLQTIHRAYPESPNLLIAIGIGRVAWYNSAQ